MRAAARMIRGVARRAGWLAAGCAAALMLASPAAAQDTGSIIDRGRPAQVVEGLDRASQMRVFLAQLASCLERRYPVIVRKALSSGYGADYGKRIESLEITECMSSGYFRFRPDDLRGPLFAASWRRYHHEGPPADLALDAPLMTPAELAGGSFVQTMRLDQYALAQCVVKANPAGSHAVVMISGTGDRSALMRALRVLTPQFTSCGQGGPRLEFTPEDMSGLLAEILYRAAAKRPAQAEAR